MLGGPPSPLPFIITLQQNVLLKICMCVHTYFFMCGPLTTTQKTKKKLTHGPLPYDIFFTYVCNLKSRLKRKKGAQFSLCGEGKLELGASPARSIGTRYPRFFANEWIMFIHNSFSRRPFKIFLKLCLCGLRKRKFCWGHFSKGDYLCKDPPSTCNLNLTR